MITVEKGVYNIAGVQVFDLERASKELGISPDKLKRDYIYKGIFSFSKIGKEIYIDVEQIQQYMRGETEEQIIGLKRRKMTQKRKRTKQKNKYYNK